MLMVTSEYKSRGKFRNGYKIWFYKRIGLKQKTLKLQQFTWVDIVDIPVLRVEPNPSEVIPLKNLIFPVFS